MLTYPVVIITWVHYYLAGGADVPGVPCTHQIRQFKNLLYLRVAGEAPADFQTGAYPVVIIIWVHYYLGGGANVPSGHYYLGSLLLGWKC